MQSNISLDFLMEMGALECQARAGTVLGQLQPSLLANLTTEENPQSCAF